MLFTFYEILIEHNTRNDEGKSYVGGEYNLFAQDGRDEEKRKEGRKITKLVDKCVVGGEAHS